MDLQEKLNDKSKMKFNSLLRWFWGAYLGCALLTSCAGSKFAVHQDELAKRSHSNNRTTVIHNSFNRR
jgi:hypothetical protein